MANYDYDPDAAGKADDVAGRIDTSAAYIGTFKSAHAIKSDRTGTEGIHFEFVSPGGGATNFDIWTKKQDGSSIFGMNQLQAMMAILGLRGLRSVQGKYEGWDNGKRAEMTGEVFPDLVDKPIGLVLQKELYTKQDGGDSFRMGLFGVFHPTSRLTASEIREGKVKGEKLEKMIRGLKTKDSRTKATAEPPQPAVGAAGDY